MVNLIALRVKFCHGEMFDERLIELFFNEEGRDFIELISKGKLYGSFTIMLPEK